MAKNELYTVDLMTQNDTQGYSRYVCTKVDKGTLIENGKYNVSRGRGIFICDCYAGNKEKCRHREMVEIFTDAEAIGSAKLYDYDRSKWDVRKLPTMEDDSI